MKRHGHSEKSDKIEENKSKKIAKDEESSNNQGFGDWLRSSDGAEMMRLFVIANSLLVFITIAWPNMQQVWGIIQDYVMGIDED